MVALMMMMMMMMQMLPSHSKTRAGASSGSRDESEGEKSARTISKVAVQQRGRRWYANGDIPRAPGSATSGEEGSIGTAGNTYLDSVIRVCVHVMRVRHLGYTYMCVWAISMLAILVCFRRGTNHASGMWKIDVRAPLSFSPYLTSLGGQRSCSTRIGTAASRTHAGSTRHVAPMALFRKNQKAQPHDQ